VIFDLLLELRSFIPPSITSAQVRNNRTNKYSLKHVDIDEILELPCSCKSKEEDSLSCLESYSRKDVKSIRKDWCYLGIQGIINEEAMYQKLAAYLISAEVKPENHIHTHQSGSIHNV
jgi:hypothetical protein